MKFLKPLLSISVTSMILLSIGTEFTSCEKVVVRDTVTQVIRDTIKQTIRDTVKEVIHDTVHSCENINAGMMAYYPFTNGSLKDSSGNNNDIYFNSAVTTTDRFGNANNAYLFNGTSSYMKVRNSNTLNPLHISLVAIIKLNDFNRASCETNQVLGKGWNDNTNGFYFMRFKDKFSDCNASTPPPVNNEYFLSGYGDNSQRTAASADTSLIKLNNWYTVIYTYDGFESRLYVNGQLKNIFVKTASFTSNQMDLSIGSHEDPSFRFFFNGVIDEVRIYNKALCEGQVKAFDNLKR